MSELLKVETQGQLVAVLCALAAGKITDAEADELLDTPKIPARNLVRTAIREGTGMAAFNDLTKTNEKLRKP